MLKNKNKTKTVKRDFSALKEGRDGYVAPPLPTFFKMDENDHFVGAYTGVPRTMEILDKKTKLRKTVRVWDFLRSDGEVVALSGRAMLDRAMDVAIDAMGTDVDGEIFLVERDENERTGDGNPMGIYLVTAMGKTWTPELKDAELQGCTFTKLDVK